MERATRCESSVDDLNEKIAEYFSIHKHRNPPTLEEDQLRRIRDRVRELHVQWGALLEDQTLELIF